MKLQYSVQVHQRRKVQLCFFSLKTRERLIFKIIADFTEWVLIVFHQRVQIKVSCTFVFFVLSLKRLSRFDKKPRRSILVAQIEWQQMLVIVAAATLCILHVCRLFNFSTQFPTESSFRLISNLISVMHSLMLRFGGKCNARFLGQQSELIFRNHVELRAWASLWWKADENLIGNREREKNSHKTINRYQIATKRGTKNV